MGDDDQSDNRLRGTGRDSLGMPDLGPDPFSSRSTNTVGRTRRRRDQR